VRREDHMFRDSQKDWGETYDLNYDVKYVIQQMCVCIKDFDFNSVKTFRSIKIRDYKLEVNPGYIKQTDTIAAINISINGFIDLYFRRRPFIESMSLRSNSIKLNVVILPRDDEILVSCDNIEYMNIFKRPKAHKIYRKACVEHKNHTRANA